MRGVEHVIRQRAKSDSEAEWLHDEFLDLLEDLDLDDDIAERPIVEIIQEICRDLGVTHSPDTPADIVILPGRVALTTPPETQTSHDVNVVVAMRPRK
jgi:hypothetical protein